MSDLQIIDRLYEALQEMTDLYDAPENFTAQQRVAIWERAQSAMRIAQGEAK